MGPIPFRFNPQWANHPEFLKIVGEAWYPPVSGSPFYVWEEKLRRTKKALKGWAKSIPPPNQIKLQAAHALELHQASMEDRTVGNSDIQIESKLQLELHTACRLESEWWRQKARCKWMKEGDRNTSFFHKQAEARKNVNFVQEIQAHGRLISNFEEIKEEATRHFKDLFTAQPVSEDVDLLQLIPRAVNYK